MTRSVDAEDERPEGDSGPEERFEGLDPLFKQILVLLGLVLLAVVIVIVYTIVRA